MLVAGFVWSAEWIFDESTYTRFYVSFYCTNNIFLTGTYYTPKAETEEEAWRFLENKLYRACSNFGYYFSHILSLEPIGYI